MKTVLIALTLAWSAPLCAQEPFNSFEAANQRCEAARQQRLAPIRAQKIAQCRRSASPPTAGCETFYSTYGNNSNHANGSVIRGRFYDLPACVKARKFERRMNKQTF